MGVACILLCRSVGFVFFKQKTAYEMRISDWSSDVCSSDLDRHYRGRQPVDLGAVVADVEDRELQLVADAFDHRHDVAAPRRVERRERFVHQQDFGGREQRAADRDTLRLAARSEEHTSELQSLMRNSYAVFCLKKQNTTTT